jgi:mono/diheme cytochrome c family protein
MTGKYALALALVAVAATALPEAARAQEQDPQMVALGLRVWKEKIACNQCHGWAGNGVPDDSRMPVGANLRQTKLSPEQIATVVKCGLLDTEMPHFDPRAYEDDRCYGKTAEQVKAAGSDKPPFGGTGLIPREIQGVVAYLQAKVVGRGPFTRDDCEDFFGKGAQVCNTFSYGAGPQPPPPAGAVNLPGPQGPQVH